MADFDRGNPELPGPIVRLLVLALYVGAGVGAVVAGTGLWWALW